MINGNFSIIVNNLNNTTLQRLTHQICHHSFKLDMRATDSKLALLKTSFMDFNTTDSNSLLNVSVMN